MKMDGHQSHNAAGTDKGAGIYTILQLVHFLSHPNNHLAAHTFPAGPHGVKVVKHTPV